MSTTKLGDNQRYLFTIRLRNSTISGVQPLYHQQCCSCEFDFGLQVALQAKRWLSGHCTCSSLLPFPSVVSLSFHQLPILRPQVGGEVTPGRREAPGR